MSTEPIIIVGGGHAAAQLCASLVDGGNTRPVHLVCEEEPVPYHRPPLSKAYLKNDDEPLSVIRAAQWYAERDITVHSGDAVQAIYRDRRQVSLRSRAVLDYGHLVLATGARARWLPHLPEALDNIGSVRTAADAQRLRGLIHQARHVTVLGGGFIGLEVAATARALGKDVTVLESAPRLLGRALSADLSAHVLDAHRASGVDVRLGVSVGQFEFDERRVHAVQVDGERHALDLLVVGIGAVPETSLAHAAGLACENGIVVDALMRTADERVLAIGDCTSFPAHALASHSSGRLRLESVQNANDQARTAAATLLGRTEPYQALPWFWSEQGSMRLQMAGLLPADGVGAHQFRRPGNQPTSFSILHVVDGVLACAESVNATLDHMAARKLIEQRKVIDTTRACDPAVSLKSLG